MNYSARTQRGTRRLEPKYDCSRRMQHRANKRPALRAHDVVLAAQDWAARISVFASIALAIGAGSAHAGSIHGASPQQQIELIGWGRYLATIGVCSACHTPPNVPAIQSTDVAELARERVFRTDPDWFKYLDPEGGNYLAGGVPFILRLGPKLSGIVYTTNITPDPTDGIGSWTEQEIADAIRNGRRPSKAITADRPEYLYLFPPHSFYRNLTNEDALALAYYLKSIAPKRNSSPIPPRQLPPGFEPDSDSNPFGPVSALDKAPRGRSSNALNISHDLWSDAANVTPITAMILGWSSSRRPMRHI